jgi:hypothetical protein
VLPSPAVRVLDDRERRSFLSACCFLA